MMVFFDTEFTNLDNKNSPQRLISIGCVAQDGREFYAELSDGWNAEQCSVFVLKTVLPLLQGGDSRMTEAELAIRIKEWIESLGEKQVNFVSDAPSHDWPWIEKLFQENNYWPKNLRRSCGAIIFEEHRQRFRFRAGLDYFWKTNIALQHHALVDARSLYFAWKYACR